jgi:ankyrin repeat protein
MSTQFLEAVKKGDRAVVDQMLDADPSLASAKDASGISAVLLAHYYGKADVAAALLSRGPALDVFEAGADPNAKSREGGTPLHSAGFTGDLETAELLLAYGADPNATDPKSFTPLDVARDRRNVEVAALLHRAVTNRRRI